MQDDWKERRIMNKGYWTDEHSVVVKLSGTIGLPLVANRGASKKEPLATVPVKEKFIEFKNLKNRDVRIFLKKHWNVGKCRIVMKKSKTFKTGCENHSQTTGRQKMIALHCFLNRFSVNQQENYFSVYTQNFHVCSWLKQYHNDLFLFWPNKLEFVHRDANFQKKILVEKTDSNSEIHILKSTALVDFDKYSRGFP